VQNLNSNSRLVFGQDICQVLGDRLTSFAYIPLSCVTITVSSFLVQVWPSSNFNSVQAVGGVTVPGQSATLLWMEVLRSDYLTGLLMIPSTVSLAVTLDT
jgi:hypothetical protein